MNVSRMLPSLEATGNRHGLDEQVAYGQCLRHSMCEVEGLHQPSAILSRGIFSKALQGRHEINKIVRLVFSCCSSLTRFYLLPVVYRGTVKTNRTLPPNNLFPQSHASAIMHTNGVVFRGRAQWSLKTLKQVEDLLHIWQPRIPSGEQT